MSKGLCTLRNFGKPVYEDVLTGNKFALPPTKQGHPRTVQPDTTAGLGCILGCQ